MEGTERFYCNEKLVHQLSVALLILFNTKKPVMKITDSYNINIKLETDRINIDISETNCDQNQGELQAAAPEVEQVINTTNNAPSPSPASSNKIKSETAFISKQILPTTILNSQHFSFFIPFMKNATDKENAVTGVGDPNGVFWIGFDNLHSIMGDRRHVLNIVHTLEDGSKRDSTYDDFRVGWDGKGIKSLGKFFGRTGEDHLRDYENQPPKEPLWFVSLCTMDMETNRLIKSSVMQIKPWPGGF
nr:uncharacterized protein LOC108070452 [Drosophila kikkawai]